MLDRFSRRLKLPAVALWLLWSNAAAWQICPDSGAVCPNENLCVGDRLCLSGNRGSAAVSTACVDDNDGGGGGVATTGCGKGFACADGGVCEAVRDESPADDENDADDFIILLRGGGGVEEVLPSQVPRYKLCSVTADMTHTYGLPMTATMAAVAPASTPRVRGHATKKLVTLAAAYLSTHGPLHDDPDTTTTATRFANVRHAIILVHGSSRNADDYLCCTSAAVPAGTDPATVLIVAPWFLAPADDGPVAVTYTASQDALSLSLLHWADASPYGVDHTWRYGAPSLEDATISSFDVMDVLLERHLYDTRKFPALRQIVITGHSAGGQLVQRHALLSPAIRDQDGDDDDARPPHRNATIPLPAVRTVVANPKSYAYLDARRWVDQNFTVPSAESVRHCPAYNEWTWGLDHSTALSVPYFHTAIAAAAAPGGSHGGTTGTTAQLVQRYATRHVVYLSGREDVWRNGDCEANLQGPNRRVRSERFAAALREYYGGSGSDAATAARRHRRVEVPNVHHDHCLMYQSPQGQQALFGGSEVDDDDPSRIIGRGRNHQRMKPVEDVVPDNNDAV